VTIEEIKDFSVECELKKMQHEKVREDNAMLVEEFNMCLKQMKLGKGGEDDKSFYRKMVELDYSKMQRLKSPTKRLINMRGTPLI